MITIVVLAIAIFLTLTLLDKIYANVKKNPLSNLFKLYL
jgi:hypothetical protein